MREQTGISVVSEENTLDPRIHKTLQAFDKYYGKDGKILPEPDKVYENALVVNEHDVMSPNSGQRPYL